MFAAVHESGYVRIFGRRQDAVSTWGSVPTTWVTVYTGDMGNTSLVRARPLP
jgi:hypothetical protein